MTYTDIIADIKKKEYRPVYLLHGEEPFFIDTISKYIEENVLDEAERAFNLSVLYGKDADHKTVVDNARRYPMMAERQVVILKEAQDMKSLEDLKSYAEQPMPSTIFVICHKHKRLNLNTKLGRVLAKNALVFESKPLYDNEIAAWATSYMKAKGFALEAPAAVLVGEYLGTELGKIANELDKLMLNLPKGTTVTQQHVQDNIGISKEYNIFELQDALAAKNADKANRIIWHFAENPKKNPTTVVISTIFGFFAKVYCTYAHHAKNDLDLAQVLGLPARNQYAAAFLVKKYRTAVRHYSIKQTEAAFAILREYDLKSKGVGYNGVGKPEGELLKEMVFRILHSD
jgi:DNA polymerase-3 subunit delta